MNLFFDTSALVKHFHEEPGSDVVTHLISSVDNNIWILELSRIEFLSALYRRFRNREINEENLAQAIDGFNKEISSFEVDVLSRSVVKEAEFLLQKYGKNLGLRTLDAFHLASFSLNQQSDWTFVAADMNLVATADKIGFKTINPLS